MLTTDARPMCADRSGRPLRWPGVLAAVAWCSMRAGESAVDPLPTPTWTADNGNGTYTNPLFYDEFSDPDLIRVGQDFYLTGTTMHAMPGLPVLHSTDLVNWSLASYACDRLDFGPEYRLEGGKSIYGQGIWAPSLRYRNGTFYIFSNVNHRKTQLFTATDPAGPWTHAEMKQSFHDLSVLFDDDGQTYVVWGYRDIHLARLNDHLDDIVPGSERVIIDKSAGMGEGSHFYKIAGTYFITSAWYSGRMRMPCARADRPEGPYEVKREISAEEEFGLSEGNRLVNERSGDFALRPADAQHVGRMSLHQGGLVSTAGGEWWGFSMMDANSVGRLTCLSPVTWQDGWPYFGLPGNLTRTPRTWVKPATGRDAAPTAPYQRNDEFDGPALANAWQWNHMPLDGQWSLSERPGFLRLHPQPAADLWQARNTLTQRAVGPQSVPTTLLDAGGLQPGDIAGLALLNYPYAWIGVRRTADGYQMEQFDQRSGRSAVAPCPGGRVWLRATCDFLAERATLGFSLDGTAFQPLGEAVAMIYQTQTFQGVRYGLFAYNSTGTVGGVADFDRFILAEPHPTGFTRAIPAGRVIRLENLRDHRLLAATGAGLAAIGADDALAGTPAAHFAVIGLPLGRVVLRCESDGRLLSVAGSGADSRVSLVPGTTAPGASETFLWTEMPHGDVLLLSLSSHRHLRIGEDGTVAADAPGAQADHANGASFTWEDVAAAR